MNESLAGKVVIVTGASSGVGEAAARAFAKQGAVVVLAARSADKLSALAKAIGGIAVPTDVSQLGDLRNLVETTVARCGRIDIVVNNAAANARGALDTLEPDAIASVIDANLKAPLLLTRLALPHLRQSRGVVVNVASIAGHVPFPFRRLSCSTISITCRTWCSRSPSSRPSKWPMRSSPAQSIASASVPSPAPRWYSRNWPRPSLGCRSGCGPRSKPKGRG